MKKQLVIILNGKGGVGKSFFATNLVQYLKDQQIEHHAIDTDNENSTLKRFHGEAEFININNVQEIDALFAALEKSSLVVVDCRAASTDIFLDYFAEVRAFEILEMLDAALTIVSPVNHEADSVEQVKIIAEALGAKCRYLIVRNQAHSEQFRIYDNSQTRSRVLGELAGREILMPKLYDWLVTGLNETNLSMTAAIAGSEFSLVDRQRLKNWQANFYEQLDQARDLILPNAEQAKSGGKTKKKPALPAEQAGAAVS
jgi:CobQ/CobB/MinD/ParA nucleotide binding domain